MSGLEEHRQHRVAGEHLVEHAGGGGQSSGRGGVIHQRLDRWDTESLALILPSQVHGEAYAENPSRTDDRDVPGDSVFVFLLQLPSSYGTRTRLTIRRLGGARETEAGRTFLCEYLAGCIDGNAFSFGTLFLDLLHSVVRPVLLSVRPPLLCSQYRFNGRGNDDALEDISADSEYI